METEKNNNRRRNMKGWSLGGVRHKNGCWICLSDRGGGEAKIYSQGGRENRREGGREGSVPLKILFLGSSSSFPVSSFLSFPFSFCSPFSPPPSVSTGPSVPSFPPPPSLVLPLNPFVPFPSFFSSFPAIPLPPLVSFSSCRSLSPPLPFLSAVVSVRERVSGSRAIQVGNKSLTPRRKRGVWAGMAGRR